MALTFLHSPEGLEALGVDLAMGGGPLGFALDTGHFFLHDGNQTWKIDRVACDSLQSLQPAFAQREIVLQDGRAQIKHLNLRGVYPTRVFCLHTAKHLLYNGIEAPETATWLEEVIPGITSDLDEKERVPADSLLELRSALNGILRERGLTRTMALEGKLLPIVITMEKNGFPADRDRFRLLHADMTDKSDEVVTRLRASLQSPDLDPNNVEALLTAFRRNGVEIARTGDEVLAQIAHPGATLLREYRSYQVQARQASSYCAAIGRDGRIHATFDPLGADTGRFTCMEPNLQGVAHGPIRHCFAATQNRELVCCDYSQIELRVIAALAGERLMLDSFASGIDLHAQTIASLLKKKIGDVSREERAKGKALNFGFIFGQSAKSVQSSALATHGVKLSLTEATSFRNDWFKLYPGVAAWHKNAWKQVEEIRQGRAKSEVRTALGRQRLLSDSLSDWDIFAQIANTPIQGSCGDGIKLALVALSRALPPDARLVSVIHDEIITDVPKGRGQEVEKIVIAEMVKSMEWLIRGVKIEVDNTVVPDLGQRDGASPYSFDHSRLSLLPPAIGVSEKSISMQVPVREVVSRDSKHNPVSSPRSTSYACDKLSDLALVEMTMPLSFIWKKSELPLPPEFHETEGFKCRSPFRKDNAPSFSVYRSKRNGSYRFIDVSVPNGARRRGVDMGGCYDFYKLAKGITDNKIGVSDFLKIAAFPETESSRQEWREKLRSRISNMPAEQAVWPPAEKPMLPYRWSRGSAEERRQLCQVREFSLAGVDLAIQEGVLRFGRYLQQPAWFVTSPEGYNIQARRLDGQRWDIPRLQNPKGMSLKGTCADWSPGIEYVSDRPYAVICEGGPDFIAAYDFIAAAGLQGKVAPVGLLGVNVRIHPQLLGKFAGKKVIFFAHCDNPDGVKAGSAGEDAAQIWKEVLTQAGADTHILNFSEVGKRLGAAKPIKDLCELLPYRSQFKAGKLFGHFSTKEPLPSPLSPLPSDRLLHPVPSPISLIAR